MWGGTLEAWTLSLNRSPSVVVVTASVGRAALRRCAESVQEQEYSKVRHLVAVDSPEHLSDVAQALQSVSRTKELNILVLPKKTGHSNHFGYRIYGAIPLLSDEDIVCYLDEDNWFEPDHVPSAIDALTTTGASWAYALRKICSDHGVPLCDDDCDSLGYWPKFATMLPDGELERGEMARHTSHPNLVDSSCYVLPRQLACALAPLWQALHADSVVSSFLVQRYAGACSGTSTVNYALGGGSGTPVEWFTDGNRRIRELYNSAELPWRQGPQKIGPVTIKHPA
jgi:glycosyl transferase family 2